MQTLSSLKLALLGLAIAPAAALAQTPPPPPVPQPVSSAASSQSMAITQSSRVRAFSAGPGGEIRSLYLRNGSVVDLAPAIGDQLDAANTKGKNVTVTGTKAEIGGQSVIEATGLLINGRNFSAAAPGGLVAEGAAPPPPGAPNAPPNPREDARPPAPCGAARIGPMAHGRVGGPPPPPDGAAPAPPPPPPPPTANGDAPPPPPADGSAPVPPQAPR